MIWLLFCDWLRPDGAAAFSERDGERGSGWDEQHASAAGDERHAGEDQGLQSDALRLDCWGRAQVSNSHLLYVCVILSICWLDPLTLTLYSNSILSICWLDPLTLELYSNSILSICWLDPLTLELYSNSILSICWLDPLTLALYSNSIWSICWLDPLTLALSILILFDLFVDLTL